MVRAGRGGEQEQANLEHNVATIGWNVGDLMQVANREDVRELVDAAFPEDSTGRRANFTGKIWAFRSLIQQGDIVVMPSKLRSGYLYLGKCGGNYTYQADELNAGRRHQIPVIWQQELVSKSVMKDDLLYSLNATMTVFNPTRNNAAQRVLPLRPWKRPWQQ